MRVRRKTKDGVLTFGVTGLLRGTPRSIELFQGISRDVSNGLQEVHLDLGGVLFIDSLWLGFLVSLTIQCRETNTPFTIDAISKQALREIHDARLHEALPVPVEVVQ